MRTDLTSGIDTNIKGALRFCAFLFLIILFVPFYLIARIVYPQSRITWPHLFHHILTKILGFDIHVHGQVTQDSPTLFVSNHSSYLDIPILGSLLYGSFIAKAEVNSWPLFGFLSRLQETVFIERRAIRAGKQGEILLNRLKQNRNLILFPEGTSSDGQHILPFKSSLFSVVEKGLEDGGKVFVQPISVVCTKVSGLSMGDMWRPFYAWYGDMTLVPHLWDAFKIGSFEIDVTFHPPVTIDEFGSRKLLAQHCQQAVASGISSSVSGRQNEKNQND